MKKIEIGQKIGHLTILKDNGDKTYLCKCDCGDFVNIKRQYLLQRVPLNKTCGCRFESLYGMKFNKLKAIKYDKKKDYKLYWIFKCDCGKFVSLEGNRVKRGNKISCGCVVTNKKHGLSGTPLYKKWATMKRRCKDKKRKNYYGKGITYDIRWEKFEKFYDDMGVSFYKHINEYGIVDTTLDRIDVSKNYCKDNCRWATRREQCNNKGNNHYYMKRSLADWSRIINIDYDTVMRRIKRGWSEQRALGLTPNRKLIKIVLNVAKDLGDKEKVKTLEELLR
ncbi:hypothetical protein [Clostridium sp.]|uniref:hypothetical protein n=1 Tax=Clostridium sp. TaxID=1506 RepID=UPI003F7F2255